MTRRSSQGPRALARTRYSPNCRGDGSLAISLALASSPSQRDCRVVRPAHQERRRGSCWGFPPLVGRWFGWFADFGFGGSGCRRYGQRAFLRIELLGLRVLTVRFCMNHPRAAVVRPAVLVYAVPGILPAFAIASGAENPTCCPPQAHLRPCTVAAVGRDYPNPVNPVFRCWLAPGVGRWAVALGLPPD